MIERKSSYSVLDSSKVQQLATRKPSVTHQQYHSARPPPSSTGRTTMISIHSMTIFSAASARCSLHFVTNKGRRLVVLNAGDQRQATGRGQHRWLSTANLRIINTCVHRSRQFFDCPFIYTRQLNTPVTYHSTRPQPFNFMPTHTLVRLDSLCEKMYHSNDHCLPNNALHTLSCPVNTTQMA